MLQCHWGETLKPLLTIESRAFKVRDDRHSTSPAGPVRGKQIVSTVRQLGGKE